MPEFIQRLFESDFMPHGGCYFWQPDILWLHVGSDALIALAYYSIPAALWYFVKKREDLTFSWIFILFGVFIFACGTTHLMSLWTTWHATYRIEGVIKLVTALVSLATAVLLWPLIPKALSLPSPAQLARSNDALLEEIRIRQQAQREAQLHLTQLAHFDRMNTLGEMSASLGHELHQPLGAIANFARGCERTLAAGGDPEKLAEVLRKISDQADRAAEIVRRTRAFSSRRELRKLPTDVEELLGEVVDLVDAMVRHQHVTLRVEVAPELPAVMVDRIQVQQVLINLIKNGAESMQTLPEAERHLTLSCDVRPADPSTDREILEIRVSDRGVGATDEDLESMFEGFYSTKADGMGMGLAISRSIIEAHSGQLFAETNTHTGLTLTVQLPVSSTAV